MDEFLKFKSELYQRKSKRKLFVILFEDKGKDKNKNNKLISLRINEDDPLEIFETIWTKFKYLKVFN